MKQAHDNTYLDTLAKRSRESRVYRRYQLVGLLIADLLHDRLHKSLYIKLAKLHGADRLFALAEDVAQRSNIKNRGAYFMRLLSKKETV